MRILKYIATYLLVAFLSSGFALHSAKAETATFSQKEVGMLVGLFDELCLQTLPSFSKFNAVAKAKKFSRVRITGPVDRAYQAPGKFLRAGIGRKGKYTACSLAFIGPADSKTAGAAFLKKATGKTGGQPQEKFPSSFFAYAYYLHNSSILTLDVRKVSGQTRYVVSISPPVPRSAVDTYLYN